MKLSAWARKNGISYQTAWNWFKAGKLPVRAMQTPTGTILIQEEAPLEKQKVALYARVSSADQKNDLERQIERLVGFAAAQGLQVASIEKEIGFGSNGARPKLLKLLARKDVAAIIVEHRDRLCRFGFEYIEAALSAQDRRLIVMNDTEVSDDLVRDMVEVLTSFCARLYGRRGAKRKAQAALDAANQA